MTEQRIRISVTAVLTILVVVAAHSGRRSQASAQMSVATWAVEVRSAERAFAKTMANRDHAVFVSFLSDEAIFLGQNTTLRGKLAVAEGWKRFYESPQAPFSWEPERVEVIASGTLAISTGPVLDPQGKRIGTFNSVWRRQTDATWKIILDNGCPPCDCPVAGNPAPRPRT